jgi:ADP-ribosylglycohydrolase
VRAEHEIKSGGFVLDTTAAAFCAFAMHNTFEQTVIEAVGLGGDADTTGAVAGALAGAYYGESAIPGRWLALLQPRSVLKSLAQLLYEASLPSNDQSAGAASFR